jgi:hypothetical protein
MAMWEITITCCDGSRLRLSERRDHAPLKGGIFATADTGQMIKARIDAYREEQPTGPRPPFFQVTATEIWKSAKVTPRRFPAPWTVEDNGACFIMKDKSGFAVAYVYYEQESGRRSAANLLTRDEVRRIAVNISKLPDLVNRAATLDKSRPSWRR